jgi:hypothetical protein
VVGPAPLPIYHLETGWALSSCSLLPVLFIALHKPTVWIETGSGACLVCAGILGGGGCFRGGDVGAWMLRFDLRGEESDASSISSSHIRLLTE